jgi:hypothetical protein
MGYRVLYDNQLLFDPYMDDRITDTKLSSKLNSASYFDFTIAPTHSLYSKLKERSGEVRIYFNNLILFKGEITKIEEDFEGNYSVSCKGVLDYLTATRVRPYSTVQGEQPLTCPATFDGYFQWLIDQHNSNCLDSRKRFSVGVNQGNMLDKNNYIYRSSEQRPTTASEIEDKILNSNGGYLFVHYQDDLNILDLYADVHDVNTQIIDYGVNMIDFTKTTTTEGQYTAVVATGYTPNPPEGQTDAKMKPITLDGCADGGTPYSSTIVKMGDRVYDVEAVNRYGYHEYYASNSDIKTYDGLLYYACKTLNTLLSPALTISVKAVDLALIMGEKYKHLQLGQAVRIRSKPRKVDEYLMVNSIDLDLMNPENTTFDLGASYDTLTGQQSAYLKTLNASINASLDTVSALGDNVKNSAKLAQEAKDTANTAKANASSAVEKANSATTKANDAATKAESATNKANEATTKANLVEKKAVEAKNAADSAKQAADEASTAAGNAQTSANNANKAATEAKNSADAANTAAGKAQSTANTALSSAAQANKDVSNVKTQITDINREMTSVKQDAATLRDDLTGQITTVKETMEADYTKKSELSATETNLKTEISKSAAGLRTEVSQTYSTKKELETTTKAAQTAQNTANTAKQNAATAQSTADAAKRASESNASDLANAVSKFNGDISGLKDQIDGAIQTWFYDGIPNALTEPEVHWTTEKDRQTHLGDLYYDNKTGFCYRYMNQNGVYSWARIKDTEVTKALADAATAQNTANAKKRIFITTPKPPYDIGDLWVQGSTGDIMNCQTPKIAGQAYAEADWVKASKYTDDTAVKNLSNTVEKTYATKSTVNQLSDRIEQTVSSVEEVRTNASAANTAAANAKKAADAASAAASTAQSTASAAQSKANAAASAAATAQMAADTAKQNATNAANAAATAQSKATAAQNAADAAKANASAAQNAANAANADLATAKKNLETLQGRADATDSEIAAAKTAVSKAQNAADAANSAASKANTAAATAQSTADTAKQNAATAQSKANDAAKAATTAQSTADTAKANAATAQNKANEAASAASTAQNTANTAKANAQKAQDDVNALKNRVATAETSIKQNSEAIALRATKTDLYSYTEGNNLWSNQWFDLTKAPITSGGSFPSKSDGTVGLRGGNAIIVDGRDHFCANAYIPFVAGHSYRMQMDVKDKSGHGFNINHDSNIHTAPKLGFWFTKQTSGHQYDGPYDSPHTVKDLGSGWYEYTVEYYNVYSNTTIYQAFSPFVRIETSDNLNPYGYLAYYISNLRVYDITDEVSSKKYTDAQLKITADSITSTVSSKYSLKQYPDTRDDNNTPGWYFTHYPKQSITEFKLCSVIGLSGESFCALLTEVPWENASGGYPKQTASVMDKRYWRVGVNGSTWSRWNDVTGLATTASNTANNALSTANTANSTANTVKNDLANLSVGGRNYLSLSKLVRASYWNVDYQNGWLTGKADGDGRGWGYANSDWKDIELKAGSYVLSIEVKIATDFPHAAFKTFLRPNVEWFSGGVEYFNTTGIHHYNFTSSSDITIGLMVKIGNVSGRVPGVCRFWIQSGNKPTDWSPAPEDYSTTTEMNSSINQTAESIKSSVAATYVNNETLSSYATKSQLEQTSTSLTSRIQTTEKSVSGMSTTVKNVNDYMTFARENNQPTLTIGSSSSSFRTKLTNTSEKFMQGDQTIMELDGVTSTVKASRVQMGHYQWRDTGTSMQLVYIP